MAGRAITHWKEFRQRKEAGHPVFQPNAAGIDIGAREIYVAVPADRDDHPVRKCETFTGDLHQMAEWLVRCGIRTAGMESTGVYWIPVYDVREQHGIQPCLMNPRNMKNVPGKRTGFLRVPVDSASAFDGAAAFSLPAGGRGMCGSFADAASQRSGGDASQHGLRKYSVRVERFPALTCYWRLRLRRRSVLRALIVVVLAVLRDLIRIGFRSRTEIIAENLFLRRQLALYQERKTRRRRPTPPTKLALVVLSRFFPWAPALAIVQPSTFVRWHRADFRLFWHWKSRPVGRPPLPKNLQTLILTMAGENPSWGEARIADVLSLKLGLLVGARTVGKYLKQASRPRPPTNQRWATF